MCSCIVYGNYVNVNCTLIHNCACTSFIIHCTYSEFTNYEGYI